MSLKAQPIPEVTVQTRLVAQAAFPKGTPYVLLCVMNLERSLVIKIF